MIGDTPRPGPAHDHARRDEATVRFEPIGTIRSPFSALTGMPIQPAGALGVKGTIEMVADYVPGLRDLDGFSHVILLYLFHASRGFDLEVVPFMDAVPHGVFATRAPRRPNAIGLSVVRLEKIEGPALFIENVDILDGTPLLDIKPCVPGFDGLSDVRIGWVERNGRAVTQRRSDDRFT